MAKETRMTTTRLQAHKRNGTKIAMITAYDYPTARLVDEAGVDMILVGDSLGMVVLGYDSTIPVTMEEMLHHTKAVVRGRKRALVVADMPFLSYHGSLESTLKNAGRFLQEAGADAVKLEGGAEVADRVRMLVRAGIPVMGHIGLTPQSVNVLGGYKVQGKDEASARKLIDDALALQEAGAFAIVIECVPAALAELVSAQLTVPTIGIGAGQGCDGQVLVIHDLLGLSDKVSPKFAKQYASLSEVLIEAVGQYVAEVKMGTFPGPEHTFRADEELISRLYGVKA